MGLVHRFLAASLFIWPLDHSFHSFTPIPPPFYFSSDKSVCQVPGPICVGAHGWKVRVYQGPGVQLVECGVRVIGSDLNRMWRKRGEKNEGRVGRVPSLFHFLSPFFFLVNFSIAFYYLNAWNRLTRGWLCQKWKLLDKPGTHLH